MAQLRLRPPRFEREGVLTVRMWAFPPYLSWVTLALLGMFIVLMLFDDTARVQLLSTLVLFLVIAAIGWMWQRRTRPSLTGPVREALTKIAEMSPGSCAM